MKDVLCSEKFRNCAVELAERAKFRTSVSHDVREYSFQVRHLVTTESGSGSQSVKVEDPHPRMHNIVRVREE